ncbi:hypothetical protein KZX47_01235 [Thermus sp. SYSU G05001]|uniref:Uncharacterized protein n=1 Tax=Thermus brevis TaxID=2862456 RepID=A0ABS6ZUQ4_9DEIN|nr:hypothetical protein [Thermus brevis]MBW6393786.1 hypothetical protein [Thermus brevis]
MALWLVRAGKRGETEAFCLESYEHLPEELKAELPLKRIWILVEDEENA